MVTIEDLLQKPVSELTYEEFQKSRHTKGSKSVKKKKKNATPMSN